MVRAGIRFMALLGVGVLALGACGSSTPTTAPERVRDGDTFREGLVRLASDDPAKAQTVSERVVADELYDGLTQWNPTKQQAEPALATTWELSADQLQWTFTLREAKASNGESITAADVKRSLEHVTDKATGSLLAETLASVSSVNVVNDKTVRIDLAAPFADLDSLLSNPAFGIVHYSGDTAFTTGAYKVVEKTDSMWKLRRVDGATAHLDGIDITFYDNARGSYADFKLGDLDWTPISPDDADEAGKKYGTALFRPSLRTLSLTFNLANPKFSDIRFREAIVRAVERSAVATKLESSASVLNGVVPQGVVGEQAGGCGALCFHDRDRAKQLVKDAFPNGAPPVTIDVANGSPFTEAAKQQIVDDLAAIGVTATVRGTDPDKFGPVTVQPDRELFQTSWSGAYPTAGAFIDPLYRSSSPSNVSGLKREEVNRNIDDAFKATSFDGRVNAYRSAESSVMSQLPVLPIAQFPTNSVQSTRMRGISISPTGAFDVANVWAAAPVN